MFEFILVCAVAVLPISELRGAIPLALALNLPLELCLPAIIASNSLIFFPILWSLNYLYKGLEKFSLFRRVVQSIRERGKFAQRHGWLGLALWVSIPIPLTGVWSGTLLAWLLGFDWKRSFLAILMGVGIATSVVTLASLGLLKLL